MVRCTALQRCTGGCLLQLGTATAGPALTCTAADAAPDAAELMYGILQQQDDKAKAQENLVIRVCSALSSDHPCNDLELH